MLELLQLLRAEPRLLTMPDSVQRLVRRYINCRRGRLWKVNQLLQHIKRPWQSVSSDVGDWTNNATEAVIGLDYMIRAKAMRGFKSLEKAIAHPYLSEYIREFDGVCDLRKVV